MKTSVAPDIDFVILWVDGVDATWQRQRRLYEPNNNYTLATEDARGDCRYRSDSDLLRFWFRGIEKNAPWVRKIIFVSAGQVPLWLEKDHPKIEIVNHEDFIPKEYLPTFNNRTIHLNLHRIKHLSECFVLFDDDQYLLRPQSPEDYFIDGNPVLGTYLGYLNLGYSNWHRVMWNDTAIINEHFNVSQSIWKNRSKWFNPQKVGGLSFAAYNLLCFLVNKTMPVHFYGHMPYPHLKSTFVDAWNYQREVLHASCLHKFRSDDQVNQYLICAWNQMKGSFSPAPIDPLGKWYSLNPNNLDSLCNTVQHKAYPVVCINDSSNNTAPDIAFERIKDAFSSIYPEKSSFEK